MENKEKELFPAADFLKKHGWWNEEFESFWINQSQLAEAMQQYAEHCVLKERINTAKVKGEFEGFLKGIIHWGIESKYKRIIDDKIKELSLSLKAEQPNK